jgi:hypothetical protein
MSDLIQYSHRPNPKCRDEVLITVEHGYHYREVMRKCGSKQLQMEVESFVINA